VSMTAISRNPRGQGSTMRNPEDNPWYACHIMPVEGVMDVLIISYQINDREREKRKRGSGVRRVKAKKSELYIYGWVKRKS
jgi:hypothetical protein